MRRLKTHLFFLNLGNTSNLFYEDLKDGFAKRGLLLLNIFEEDLLLKQNDGNKEVVIVVVSNLQELYRLLTIKQKINRLNNHLFIEVSSFRNLQLGANVKYSNFIDLPITVSDLIDKVVLLYLRHTVSHRILEMI